MSDQRYLQWRKDWTAQHSPSRVEKNLEGVFPFKQIKRGDLKKGQGDIVIVGLGKNKHVSFKEFMDHFYSVDRIETAGIYTNVFWGRKLYNEVLKEITKA